MTHKERQCRELWGAIVKRRDRQCILSGSTYQLEAHHLFLKSQGNWKILFDPDYGVTLDQNYHIEAHGIDREEIFERIIRIILQEDEERALKILKHKNEPKKSQVINPPFPIIYQRLKEQLNQIEQTAWMDYDI